ncbi:tetratricopeptide repeat protein [Magnetococcus sp. PR-3]|uniref:tetratricopeptide repeat protein n=1 Tax=Magnetococcus sp. PR-3 TaxID=3120355 RepID=UPI002FCDF094
MLRLCLLSFFLLANTLHAPLAHAEPSEPRVMVDISLLKAGAKAGDAKDQYRLAHTILQKPPISQDHQRGAAWMKKSAQQGFLPAQYSMATLHQHGQGVTKDLQQALYWWEKAAQQGHVLAQFKLGTAYMHGTGSLIDLDKAVFWLKKAAQQDMAQAYLHLGSIQFQRTQKQQQALPYLRKAADLGLAQAQYLFGVLYQTGKIGQKNPEQAFQWFKKAALQAHPKAALQVATAYRKGQGTPKDMTAALAWMEIASQLKTTQANFLKEVIKRDLSQEQQQAAAALEKRLMQSMGKPQKGS